MNRTIISYYYRYYYYHSVFAFALQASLRQEPSSLSNSNSNNSSSSRMNWPTWPWRCPCHRSLGMSVTRSSPAGISCKRAGAQAKVSTVRTVWWSSSLTTPFVDSRCGPWGFTCSGKIEQSRQACGCVYVCVCLHNRWLETYLKSCSL